MVINMDLEKILNNLQENCNTLHDEYGATENVIRLQVAINSFRHKNDITDESQIINDSDGFVQ